MKPKAQFETLSINPDGETSGTRSGEGSTFTLHDSSEAWSPPESGAGSPLPCLPDRRADGPVLGARRNRVWSKLWPNESTWAYNLRTQQVKKKW
jgi:hypothetical protein